MARTGAKRRPGFMGGNLPLMLRIPKRGFVYPFRVSYRLVSLAALERAFPDGAEVTPASLAARGLIASARGRVKILGGGTLSRPLAVSAHAFSKSAREAIERAGGSCAVLAA
jgi:large subunit ribosomal protein L15